MEEDGAVVVVVEMDSSSQSAVPPTIIKATMAESTTTAETDGVVVDGPEDDNASLDHSPLPLLQYTQIVTSSDESNSCTCSSLSQVLVRSDGGSSGSGGSETSDAMLLDPSVWSQQPLPILSRGYHDGTVQLSCPSSLPLSYDPALFVVRDKATWTRSSPVVALSWDSTGTFAAAIDASGWCCIWELRYVPGTMLHEQQQQDQQDQPVLGKSRPSRTESVPTTTNAPPPPPPSDRKSGIFSGIMTRLTGRPPRSDTDGTLHGSEIQPTNTSSTAEDPTVASTTPTTTMTTMTVVPCIKVDVVSTSRITYPTHWKSPTCLVLDPSHKKRLALVVGLEDGRLLYTKRGGLFARRNDTVLYQGSGPIEAITWRGNLVAWADNSGVKLLDIENLTRIAHIDRPAGARATLYPTLPNLRPCLHFETSDRLLIAWGDCLMQMTIDETPAPGDGTSITMRQSVLCSMAWELDGVAAGVAPLDADRVAVLAIILPSQQQDQGDEAEDYTSSNLSIHAESNELELQIIAREDGTIHYADILPYHAHACLQSTFALPRMDDVSEWYEYKAWKGYDDGAFDLTLMSGGSGQLVGASSDGDSGGPTSIAARPTRSNIFVDPHIQWNLRSVIFEEDSTRGERSDNVEDDTDSVDSDDYSFVLRPLNLLDDPGPTASPPIMVLTSDSDAILASLSSVDDAVEHALFIQDRPALALKRALQHRRQLRKYRLPDLVQHYLDAVLRLQHGVSTESLSLRRMKLAIQAMPALLGGEIDLWSSWASKLEKLPGALFLLRSYLPVRDPILPADLYWGVLKGMFSEYEHLSQIVDSSPTTISLRQQAAQHFLESMIAWGPTKGLKELIKLYQYGRDKGGKVVGENLGRLETALHRRHAQTAADFLSFPIRSAEQSVRGTPASRYHANDSHDSLYSLDAALTFLSAKAPVLDRLDNERSLGPVEEVNDRVNLDAVARIYIMQGRYERALQAYLTIGSLHSSLSMEDLDALAIDSVPNGSTGEFVDRRVRIGGASYEFVLGLVEHHHLHRVFLAPTFIPGSKGSDASNRFHPLLALLRLVGLRRAGEFLMKHCEAPELPDITAPSMFGDDSMDAQQPETLPMDQIAAQLESTPALMHWYLNLVFSKRPELYVKFPNNSMPPDSVTELHRKHFELHIEFSRDMKDSCKVLSGLEIYKVESTATPFLRFLKAALPLGGVAPIDARRRLEIIRSEESANADDDDDDNERRVSSSFALELAHIIECHGNQNQDDIMITLQLFLEGARSIMLGVAYAQRTRGYSSLLWDKLIDHCLRSGVRGGDGTSFGALLEAAALAGADLAKLVAKIPPGMVVEGLRPRLVAAVADYRLMVDIHQAASVAASQEEVCLMREVAHRSRRGARCLFPDATSVRRIHDTPAVGEAKEGEEKEEMPIRLDRNFRPVERKSRRGFLLSLPMR